MTASRIDKRVKNARLAAGDTPEQRVEQIEAIRRAVARDIVEQLDKGARDGKRGRGIVGGFGRRGEERRIAVSGKGDLAGRDPAFAVQVEAITPADAVLIEALQSGATLAGAAALDPDHDPAPRLIALMRQGAFIKARTR